MPPAGAVLERVTVQFVTMFEVRVLFAHCKAETPMAAVMDSTTDWLDPFGSTALMVAFWSEEMRAVAVAVKVAVVARLVTSTEAGTVNAVTRLLVSVTVVPPVGAG